MFTRKALQPSASSLTLSSSPSLTFSSPRSLDRLLVHPSLSVFAGISSLLLFIESWATYASPLRTRLLTHHQGLLQGAKAQQKRERNSAKGANAAKSQLKTNEASKNIICQSCRQAFVSSFSFFCRQRWSMINSFSIDANNQGSSVSTLYTGCKVVLILFCAL